MKSLQDHGNIPIDMIVCNLYPFGSIAAKPKVSIHEMIENIDIGGRRSCARRPKTMRP